MYDSTNFSDENIEKYFKDAIDYIIDLHINTIDSESIESIEKSDMNLITKEKCYEDVQQDDGVVDKVFMEHFMQLKQQVKKSIVSDNQELAEERYKRILSEKIKKQMKQYREYCANMDVIGWLDTNGNVSYRNEKELENKCGIKKMHLRINQYYDVKCASEYFDVLVWWKKFGIHHYPEIGTMASLFLGKPLNNAFQERVFSRGTYSDTKLKRQTKEHNFEMNVLNSFNAKAIVEFDKQTKSEKCWLDYRKANYDDITVEQDLLKFNEISAINVATLGNVSNPDDLFIQKNDIENGECSECGDEPENESLNDTDDSISISDFFEENKKKSNSN